VIPAALAFFVARARPAGVLRLQEHGQPDLGGLLSVAPGILGSLVADLRGRGVEPAVVGRVLVGRPRIGVRRLPSPR
jgi:hypothetical protein